MAYAGNIGTDTDEWELVLGETLLPEDHLMQKLDIIYEENRVRYSELRRPGIDRVCWGIWTIYQKE